MKFFQNFAYEYHGSLQEVYFRNKASFKSKFRSRINDIVLIKEENGSQMNWKKGKIEELIFDNDELLWGVELLIYQSKKEKLTTMKRPVQLTIPLKICDPNEPAETHTSNDRPKRIEATKYGCNQTSIRSIVTWNFIWGSVESLKKLIITLI